MNDLQKALAGDNMGLDIYFADVTADDFRQHIKEMESPELKEYKERLIKLIQSN